MRIIKRLIAFLSQSKIALGLILIVLIGIGFIGIQNFQIDNSLRVWFVENDPAYKQYQQFIQEFGNDEIIVSLLTDTNPISNKQRLMQLSKTTQALEKIKGVAQVSSISNLPLVIQNNKALPFDSLLKTNVSQKQLNREFKKFANLKTLERFYGSIENSAVIYSWIDTLRTIEIDRNQIINKVDSVIKKFNSGAVYHGGTGIIYNAINQETIRESSVFSTLSFLILLIVFFLIVRKGIWILVFSLVVSGTLWLMFGIMGLADVKINLTITALIPMVMVLSVAILMHIYKHIATSYSSNQDLENQLMNVITPIIFTTLTTMGGFLSLTLAQMKITREYGMFAALGALLAFAFSILWVLVFKTQLSKKQPTKKSTRIFKLNTADIMLWGIKNRIYVILISGVLLVLSTWGIKKMVVDTYTMNFLPKNHKTIIHNTKIESLHGGYLPLDFLIEPYQTNYNKTDFYKSLERAQQQIDSMVFVSSTFSIVTLEKDIKRLQARQNKAMPIHSVGMVNQAAKQSKLLNNQQTRYRLSVYGKMCSASELNHRAALVENVLNKQLAPIAQVTKSGYLPLYSQIIKMVLHDQIFSLILALLIVALFIALLLKSKKMLLIALPANILPVMMLLGLMGFSGIWLDIGTVTIAAAMLGIIIDDTIHILYFIKKYLKTGDHLIEAINKTGAKSGAAILNSSLIIIMGLGVLSFSSVATIAHTGQLIALISAFALAADLLLIPALLSLFFKYNYQHSQHHLTEK